MPLAPRSEILDEATFGGHDSDSGGLRVRLCIGPERRKDLSCDCGPGCWCRELVSRSWGGSQGCLSTAITPFSARLAMVQPFASFPAYPKASTHQGTPWDAGRLRIRSPAAAKGRLSL